MRNVEGRCKKVINMMRCLPEVDWGADTAVLKNIYTALTPSRLDYGSVVYASAAKSVSARLNIVQSQALRMCLGAVRTSPVCAIQVEAREMPLWLCRKQLMVNYWINLRGFKGNHPAKKVLEECWERGRGQTTSFGWVGKSWGNN